MVDNPSDAKQPDPNVAGQPLPGQEEPSSGAKPGATPSPDGAKEPEDGNKQVPITALHEERDKRQALQAELDALKKIAGANILFDMNGNPVQANIPSPQPGKAVDTEAFEKELDKAWEEDPRKAVEMTVAASHQWRDEVDSRVESQVMEASEKFRDFNEYQNDVRRFIRSLPLNQRSIPGQVETAYFLIKGQKSDNVYSRAQQEMLDKIRRGEQVSGLNPGTVSTPAPSNSVSLSEDQLKAAAAMGLSPEQYASAIIK